MKFRIEIRFNYEIYSSEGKRENNVLEGEKQTFLDYIVCYRMRESLTLPIYIQRTSYLSTDDFLKVNGVSK